MFYVKCPDGFVSLHLLEEIIFTRLEYLEALHQSKTAEFEGNIEYLIEDSNYDSVGHFLLRLFSTTSNDFFSYWIQRERLFFKYRINHIIPRQLHRLFKRTIKYVTEDYGQESQIDRIVIKFSQFFLQPKIFHHIIDQKHPDDCLQYQLEVPFNLVPDLVKTREVELHQGQAIINCSQWKETLVSLFQTFVSYRVYGDSLVRSNSDVLKDPRLVTLNHMVQQSLLTKGLSQGSLTYKNINVKAAQFPLCMRNLHDILRRRHRLTHQARFYYTLFLKESGMKVDDAVQYWKEEYSKPHSCESVCTHNWHKDERKFVYSIRHMYGLEGRKANYKAQSCGAVCKNIPGPTFEGGCPFRNFDIKTLSNLLRSCVPEDDVKMILEEGRRTSPQEMCKKFLTLSMKNIEHNFVVTSPVQYFLKSSDKD